MEEVQMNWKKLRQDFLTTIHPNDFLRGNKKESTLHWDYDDLSSPQPVMEIPDDLDSNWLTVLVPRGYRCMVTAYQGETRATSRYGGGDIEVNIFHSLLPGGCSSHGAGGKKPPLTVLDCIFDVESQTFWVLDLISWAGTNTFLAPAEVRYERTTAMWDQVPALQTISASNPYPFLLPLTFPSTASNLYSSMLLPLSYNLDGILLVHKKSRYFPTASPLLLQINTVLSWFPQRYRAPETQGSSGAVMPGGTGPQGGTMYHDGAMQQGGGMQQGGNMQQGGTMHQGGNMHQGGGNMHQAGGQMHQGGGQMHQGGGQMPPALPLQYPPLPPPSNQFAQTMPHYPPQLS